MNTRSSAKKGKIVGMNILDDVVIKLSGTKFQGIFKDRIGRIIFLFFKDGQVTVVSQYGRIETDMVDIEGNKFTIFGKLHPSSGTGDKANYGWAYRMTYEDSILTSQVQGLYFDKKTGKTNPLAPWKEEYCILDQI